MPDTTPTPALRFAGFTDAWEQREAVDLAEYTKGFGYSKGDLTETGTPLILYGRLYTKYQFAIDDIDTFSTVKKGALLSEGNEVIIPASGETAVEIARASAVTKSGVLLGGDLNVLRPFNFIDSLFLALAISTGKPQKELAKRAQGKTVVHIHNSDIQRVRISYPTLEEQGKIVDVFKGLDALITLHQRKYSKLLSVKKSMLEKMFPKNGATVPEIRFAGFTDAWEQRKLGELLIEYNEQCEKGGLLEHVSLTKEGVVPKTARYDRDSLVQHEDKKYRVTHFDDICYNPANLKFGVICRNNYKDGIFSPIYVTFKVQEGSDPKFLEHYLTRWSFIQSALLKQEGTVYERMAVKPADLLAMDVSVPHYNEQRHIGNLFASINALITLHQRKLEKLQNLKKACLEKMFV